MIALLMRLRRPITVDTQLSNDPDFPYVNTFDAYYNYLILGRITKADFQRYLQSGRSRW